MHWGAMLMACMLALTGNALAADTSPTFGGENQIPFQLAVNPGTGQPLVAQVPTGLPVQQVAK